jgi:modulator of FtsH protease
VAPDWDNYALIMGGAAGALTGLLFVAVSLNRDRIAGHSGLRRMAAHTLVQFMIPLLLSMALVLPGISATTLGVLLLILALLTGAYMLAGVGRGSALTGDTLEDRLARLLDRVSPNALVVLLMAVAGCLQLAGADGLYWAAGSGVVALVGGVTSAWLFLTHS